MRERDRYRQAGFLEQLGDLVHWFPGHRRASGALLLVLAVLVLLAVLSPARVGLADVRAGDCLYIPGAGEIGDLAPAPLGLVAIRTALAAGGAERTPCDQSHSHEVTGVASIATDAIEAPGSSADPAPPGNVDPALQAAADRACGQITAAYLGAGSAATSLLRMAIVPTSTGARATTTLAICLVGPTKGGYLSHTARGS